MPYSKCKVFIPNVGGDISISVTTKEVEKTNLFVSTPQYTPTSTGTSVDEVAIGGRLATGGVVKYWASGHLVTRFIEAIPGDSFKIRTDSAEQNTYDWFANGYNIDKTHITQEGKNRWQFDEDGKGGIFTVPNISAWSGTKFIKLCLPYVDINNITIYKV